MRELNYQPNLLASALMTGKTKTIGLLVPDISNPFFAELCRGVEDAGADAGFNVVICNTDENLAKERQHINLLRQKGIDGIIFASAEMGGENIVDLQKSNYPVVLLARGVDGLDLTSVSVDDFEGGYLAAQHLLTLGHKRVALFAGPLRTKPALFRQKGFEAAMEQAGLKVDPDLVDSGPFTIASGMLQAERLLARTSRLPTGIVAGNDLIAIGAIKVLRRHGVRIPDDLSVVGFDRTTLAEAFDPELTSVAQPVGQLGRRALELLVEAIAEPGVRPQKVLITPELVLGASTAPCS